MKTFDRAPGWPDTRPIIDDHGTREHRGRRFPVGGCGCIPCRCASAAAIVGLR